MENTLLAIAKNEQLEDLYANVANSDLLSLPDNIEKFINGLKLSNPHLYKVLDSFHMFNSLFTSFRLKCAIKYTRETLNEPELTDNKIINIYNSFAGEWVSTDWAAMEEIQKFVDFVKVLNS